MMPRTKLSKKREIAIKEPYLGRIIIFCEGKTERYYFEYFAEIINSNGNKYSDVTVEVANIPGGNARNVLNCANEFLDESNNAQIYKNYEKVLIFDCDAPDDIQSVIVDSERYTLFVSNPLFETWLLMHFEEVDVVLKKKEIYLKLTEWLDIDKYKKGQKGLTRKIIHDSKQIENAIINAENLKNKYTSAEKTIYFNIKEMNPFTNVHEIVELLMYEITRNIR